MSEQRHEDQALYPPLNPLTTGWKGRCPRCGQGRLFKGFITPVERCANCGLDMRFSDSGDGPAVFIIMIVGFLIVGAALAVEFTLAPPIWVHMVIWLPLTVIMAVGLLRPLKGLMIAQQYRHSAQEGRIDE